MVSGMNQRKTKRLPFQRWLSELRQQALAARLEVDPDFPDPGKWKYVFENGVSPEGAIAHMVKRRYRSGKVQKLSDTITRITKVASVKRGFLMVEMFSCWSEILDSTLLAEGTRPSRISFPPKKRMGGTLYIKCQSSALAPQLLHLKDVIKFRINAYFGYGAINDIKIVHGPIRTHSDLVGRTRSLSARVQRPLTKKETRQILGLEENLEQVINTGNAAMDKALIRLGQGIAAKTKMKNKKINKKR